MTKLSYQGTKTKNIESFPNTRVVTYHQFLASEDGENSPSSLDPEETREIISILEKTVKGKRSQLLIDLFKYPKIKVTVIEGGFPLSSEQAIAKKLDEEYIEAAKLLERYDNLSEIVVTFINPVTHTAINKVVKF